MAADFTYDLAISLLDQDEPLARDIVALTSGISVFLYSERQLELVGNDGVETFSAVFRREARTVAILHRERWASTKWTRLEADALRDRVLAEGTEFLTAIKLDNSQLPPWIPATRIWAELSRLKVEGVASVLLERLRLAGSRVREETIEELAARVERERAAEARRLSFLDSEVGVYAARKEVESLFELLKQLSVPARASFTSERLISMMYRDGWSVSVNWQNSYINTLNHSRLVIKEWRGRPDIGGRFVNYEDPQELAQYRFIFDQPTPGEYVWIDESGRSFSTSGMAEHAATLLLKRIQASHPSGR